MLITSSFGTANPSSHAPLSFVSYAEARGALGGISRYRADKLIAKGHLRCVIIGRGIFIASADVVTLQALGAASIARLIATSA